MPNIKKPNIALSDLKDKERLRKQTVGDLRALWQEAARDRSEILDPDVVFNRLETKYKTLAQKAAC
jgi:hypothetical protein